MLAIVGVVALIAFGIWLAIYSSRFVPGTVGRMGTAAVALTSVFTAGGQPSLVVVPTDIADSFTTNDEEAASATNATTTAPEITPPLPQTAIPASATPTAGTASSATYPINTPATSASPATPTLSGLADLEAKIIATGYLATTSTNSFIATSTVPRGARPAVTFVIKNVGTNVAAAGWRFTAAIPTQNAYVFTSPTQPALNPGDSIEYTLGFDQASAGVGRSISIVANSDHSLGESNTNNNSATATVTIQGS